MFTYIYIYSHMKNFLWGMRLAIKDYCQKL